MKKIGLWIFRMIRIVVCVVLLFASCLALLLAIALKDSPYMIYDISDSKKIEDNIAIINDNIPWPSTLPDSTKIFIVSSGCRPVICCYIGCDSLWKDSQAF